MLLVILRPIWRNVCSVPLQPAYMKALLPCVLILQLDRQHLRPSSAQLAEYYCFLCTCCHAALKLQLGPGGYAPQQSACDMQAVA